MKVRLVGFIVVAAVVAIGIGRHRWVPEPTVLSFGIGQTFEQVVKASTYPVMERSDVPTNAHLQSGSTWVTEPAVILRLDDPKHGFTLPPTKFAMVSFMDNKVDTMATSPMLEKLPFDQTVALLEKLQNQFVAGGWEVFPDDGSKWFDFTPQGRQRLFARMLEVGAEEATLRVRNKYAMTFRMKCMDGCRTNTPPYLFLIDIGVGSDIYTIFDKP